MTFWFLCNRDVEDRLTILRSVPSDLTRCKESNRPRLLVWTAKLKPARELEMKVTNTGLVDNTCGRASCVTCYFKKEIYVGVFFLYNRCTCVDLMINSQVTALNKVTFSLRKLILQRQVFAICSCLRRAVPFSFCRSTCPAGPRWDWQAPCWPGPEPGVCGRTVGEDALRGGPNFPNGT